MGWEMDLAPTAEEFFGGFERLLAARVQERADIRRGLELPTEGSMLDSHPPTAERVADMEELPDRIPPLPDDDRPGSALISAFTRLAAVTAEETFVFGSRDRLDWDELANRVFSRNDEVTADTLYTAAARLSGEQPATLSTIVELSADGRTKSLITAVSSTLSDDVVSSWFKPLVREAAVRAGVARWRMPWSRQGELVTQDGKVFDEEPLAADLAAAGTAAMPPPAGRARGRRIRRPADIDRPARASRRCCRGHLRYEVRRCGLRRVGPGEGSRSRRSSQYA